MLLALFLLPLAAAAPLKPAQKNYILDIDNGTLKNVLLEGEALPNLDLSGMELIGLDKNAFDNVPGLKSLNLANNSLETLPDFVFSNLTNLEHLSLAENKISNVKYMFVGLEKLRFLNISYNPIVHLRRGHLFGLAKYVTIYTKGNVFWSISTGVYTNSFLKDEEDLKKMEKAKSHQKIEEKMEDEKKEIESIKRTTEAALKRKEDSTEASKVLNEDQKLKLCMTEKVVSGLTILDKEQNLPEGCSKMVVDKTDRKVNLRGLGIKSFQEGWYQIKSLPIATLDFSGNEITEITKEILNDLPADLVYVNLRENRIRRIWNQVIENENLKMLNLADNLIEVIEDGALQKMNLTGLFLSGNQLENLHFVSSLPKTLTDFVVTRNQITSIPDGSLSGLSRLIYLNLGSNKITRLQNHVFKGLESLQVLVITRNNLATIEHKAFKDLKQLSTLYLYRNYLTELEKGTFSDLESLKDLNLAWNGLTNVTKNSFSNLPKSLDFLHLDFNEIESLEVRSFTDVPRFTLSLNGNKISSIPRGTFSLPTLQDLYLNNNTLTTMDGDSYEGLPQLKRLWLAENQIMTIPKGACKNLGSLNILDISRNPFERLANGALYGLSLARGSFIYIYYNQLQELQGGIFDDF